MTDSAAKTDSPAKQVNPAVAAAEARAQQAHTSPLATQQGPDPVVVEGRRKFYRAMEDELLDYKHNGPIQIENCATTLLRIFEGAQEHPRIKSTSKTFMNHVSSVKGGEKLMMLAGWKTEVVELQKFWVYDGLPGSHKEAIMQEACTLLRRALTTIHEKAERKRNEAELRAAAERARIAQVQAALQEDQQDRRLKQQTMGPSNLGAPTLQP